MLRPALLKSNRASPRALTAVGYLEESLRRLSIPKARQFSSVRPQKDQDDEIRPKQPFATVHLEPGEFDLYHQKDPLYRAKFKSNSKIISAEDFANRPTVGFNEEFTSYEDAMVTLSWLDQTTCRQIYHMYVDMMVVSHQKYETTSHEYVTKVIAQKFNIAPWRAGAVVQLQHNEEQMRKEHPELLCDDQANYAEQTILQNIKDAYRSERLEQPDNFLEDPVGLHGRGAPDETSSMWKRTDDIFDVDQKLEDANVRDAKNARLIIDRHMYVEDVDDNAVPVKTDGRVVRKLLKGKERMANTVTVVEKEPIPYPETNAQGEKRPRWKYVAKVVDTHLLRKKGRRVQTYTNANTQNTLVEQDGELRVATVEEAKHVSWKQTRKGDEFIYAGAKRAWLDKMIHGKSDAWGRAPITKAPQPGSKEQQKEEKEETDVKAASEEESVATVATDESEPDGSNDKVEEDEKSAEVDTSIGDGDDRKEGDDGKEK
jgi:hypothetical protein